MPTHTMPVVRRYEAALACRAGFDQTPTRGPRPRSAMKLNGMQMN